MMKEKKFLTTRTFCQKNVKKKKKKVYLCELKYETYGLVENNS